MQNLFIFILIMMMLMMATVVGNIIFIKKVYASLKKYNISEYFYCSYDNQICMRFNLKMYIKHDYKFHKYHLYNNFDCLGINQEYYCKSHSVTLKYLKNLEKKNYIMILDVQKNKNIRIWFYEMQLGKKVKKIKTHNGYIIVFRVLKTLPKSIDELEP